jgi:hypothetical protein
MIEIWPWVSQISADWFMDPSAPMLYGRTFTGAKSPATIAGDDGRL